MGVVSESVCAALGPWIDTVEMALETARGPEEAEDAVEAGVEEVG